MRSLRGADGLRAIACLMVIFHHLSQKLMFNAVDPIIQAIGARAHHAAIDHRVLQRMLAQQALARSRAAVNPAQLKMG